MRFRNPFHREPKPAPQVMAPNDGLAKVLVMTKDDRIAWEDNGPFAKWQYVGLMPSGNFSVLFSEFDQTPRVAFLPTDSFVTMHETTLDQLFSDELYGAVNASIFGENWGRADRELVGELAA